MKNKTKNKTKQKDENGILYLLIILLLLIVFIYHCSYNNKIKKTTTLEEGFKTKYSEKHLAGKKIMSLPIGNPLLPRSHENISLVGCQGDFNNKKTSKSQKEKLYLDNNSKGIVLLSKGYLKVNLDKYENIDSLVIKGIKKGRVDINNSKQNEYTHLFDINTQSCSDLLQYNKLNINQVNSISPSNNLKMKSFKITNTSDKPTEPIKLELIKEYNTLMKKNNNSNKITNTKILDHNNKKIKKLIITKKNNVDSFVKIILHKPILLNGFSLITNISNFKVILENKGFNKGQLFNGGINGIEKMNYYFDEPIKTKIIKIIPFVDPKKILEKNYFISDINLYSFSSQIKEGFNTDDGETDNKGDDLRTQLKASTDIQQACQALAYQEDINRESYKLQQFKKYNLKLQKQEQELEELNRTITQLSNKRRQQMEKEDVLSVIKHQKLKGEEVKLLDKLKETKNKTIDLDLNLFEGD